MNNATSSRQFVALMFRYLLKVLLLLAAVLCVFRPASDHIAGIVPALSPFVGMMTAIAIRMLTPFLAICLPVLLIITFKRRWFCNYACPTGLLLEIAGKWRSAEARQKHLNFPKIGKWIVVLCLGGALLGCPFVVWLDPLSLLASFFSATHWKMVVVDSLSMMGLLALIILSIWRPNLWCGRICPLGASQDLVRSLASVGKRRKDEEADSVQMGVSRRAFMASAVGGVCGGLVISKSARCVDVIRPPGAISEEVFTSVCSRCGTCAAVCPAGIIHPDIGKSGLAGLMTPVITIDKTYCSEICNRCGEICPTNAIRHSSLEEKQNISIGCAEIIKDSCVGWNDSEHCMICSDYCPYGAVNRVIYNSVECPEVVEDKCRGCGACELVCPAGKLAIKVRGSEQRQLKPVKVNIVNDLIRMTLG